MNDFYLNSNHVVNDYYHSHSYHHCQPKSFIVNNFYLDSASVVINNFIVNINTQKYIRKLTISNDSYISIEPILTKKVYIYSLNSGWASNKCVLQSGSYLSAAPTSIIVDPF